MIGRNIYELRKKKGITLSELAERSNVSKSYLSNIERKLNKNPSIAVLEKISGVLGVDLKTLLSSKSDHARLRLETEYIEFAIELKNLGISKERLTDYKDLIEFIKWQKLEKLNK